MNPFIQSTRDNGETFYTLSDDAPEGLLEAVREAHNGMMPNDWVWNECREAFECEDDLTDSDELHTYADGQVEIYTQKLFQWAADMCLTGLYADASSEADDAGSDCKDVEKRFQAIQYCAVIRIASVIAAWKAEQSQ